MITDMEALQVTTNIEALRTQLMVLLGTMATATPLTREDEAQEATAPEAIIETADRIGSWRNLGDLMSTRHIVTFYTPDMC
jgi:hypothetical protein